MTQDPAQGNRQTIHTYVRFGICAFGLLLVDQVTKQLALAHLADGIKPVTSFFNLVLVWNPGISFGMFNNHDGTVGPYILIALSLLITGILAVWLTRTPRRGQQWAITVVIAGALGNVIDRAIYKAVIDFLDFHAFGYHWPAFNVADMCVVVGIAFLVIDSLFFEPKQQPAGKD
ncbi:MAG: signal peptidase II [Alphaproteobacteria bacterium]|nr:signal peptidase II [Alphaproteobacteria bacterium]MBU0859843.1 signal peptidase II [Alphaproteobacteria bacterium]